MELVNLSVVIVLHRDLGTYSVHSMNMIDPTSETTAHIDICSNILDLTMEQRKICTRSPKLFNVSVCYAILISPIYGTIPSKSTG